MIRALTPHEALGEIRETIFAYGCEALTAEEALMIYLTHPCGDYDLLRAASRLIELPSPVGALVPNYRWEPAVPFVPRHLLDSSIFLYPTRADAEAQLKWGGSGFLFGVVSSVNGEAVHLYAISNDHVVRGVKGVRASPVVRLRTAAGIPRLYDLSPDDWVPHPDGDDIAISPLGVFPKRNHIFAEQEELISPSDLDEYSVGAGDDCFMIGRYVNHLSAQQFDQPVIRFGNLSMLPDYVRQEERQFNQLSFMVDMRSVSGFSGSPVVVYHAQYGPRDPHERERGLRGKDWSLRIGKLWLLGVDWGRLPVWEDISDEYGHRSRVRVHSSMACVVPAWKIAELLEVEAVVKPREKAERALAEKGEHDAVLDVSREDEFERFDALTRKLVQVPKKELDEKRKERDQ